MVEVLVLKIEDAGTPRDKHIFDPERKSQTEVNQKKHACGSKGGVDKKHPQFGNGNAQFCAHSGEDAEPLLFDGMPDVA